MDDGNGDPRQEMNNSGATAVARLLPPLVLGAMLNPLNSTMLSTALTQLTHSFGRDVSAGALLITPLYITATIAQPLMGRLADIYSPKLVNMAGLGLVLAAAVVGIVAPSFGWLIFSRILLGLGTSANYPSAIAMLRRHYAKEGRVMPQSALGWITMGGQVSLVLGPVIGGVLTEWLGWKGIFLINIPLVAATLWLLRNIPKDGAGARRPLDLPGIFIFSLLLVTLFFTLTLRPLHWYQPVALGLLLIGLVVWEKGREDPFIHVRLFRQRPFLTLVYSQSAASSYILYLTLYGLPQWLEGVQGLSPSATGLILLPMSLMAVVSALIVPRWGLPWLTNLLAVVSAGAGSTALFLLHAGSPIGLVVGVSMLMGIATGVNPIANQVSLNEEAPQHLTGISFGLYRTFAYIGAIASGSQLKSIFHKGVTDASFREIATYATCSALILIVLYLPVWFRRGRRRPLVEAKA
ncbi:MAG TPA: MFS transporter [Puia sp.]|nr:MFS transporter [Puia sp.]